MVKWLNRAVLDLDEVEEYISQDNPDAAIDTVLAIGNAVEQLEEFPGMGRPGRIASTRELVIDGLPYIVPYRLRGKTIEILRVYHAIRAHGKRPIGLAKGSFSVPASFFDELPDERIALFSGW